MGTIPLLRPSEVVKIFERLGWEVARQRGSHIIMTKPGHIATLSIPDHPFVARGTLAVSWPEPGYLWMNSWIP